VLRLMAVGRPFAPGAEKADVQNAAKLAPANGNNADKAPFLNLSTVRPATRFSSSLCAQRRR